MRLSNGSFEPARGSNVARGSGVNSIALKIFLLLLIVPFLSPQASARDYTLEEATANITIYPEGAVHVEESVSYTFDGDYNYVYRMIRTSTEESIRNIKGYCSDDACKFRVERISEGYRLIGDLPEHTPENLTFYVSYDHYGAVKVHDDVSEFHRQWGEEWEKPLGNLKVNITFPIKNDSEILYWTHPAGYTQEENLNHNVLNLKTEEIPSSYDYKVRVVFPKIESPDSSSVRIDNEKNLEKILAEEKEYRQKELKLEGLYDITLYFLFFVLVIPVFIYLIYGRELKTGLEEKTGYEGETNSEEKTNSEGKTNPEEKTDHEMETNSEEGAGHEKETGHEDRSDHESKTDYKRKIRLIEIYKRKPDEDFRPAVVNAIMKGKLGIPTIDGFTATFMDLANRGYISLRNSGPEEADSSNISGSETEDFMIELNHEMCPEIKGKYYEIEGRRPEVRGSKSELKESELADFEKDILKLLNDHSSERKISWREFKKELEGTEEFYKFMISWGKKVRKHSEIDRFFQSTGSTYMNLFSRAILASAIVYYIALSGYFPSSEFPGVSKVNMLAALIGIWGFIMTKNSEIFVKVFGRWTSEGKLYYELWGNFREYITDQSALKNCPPESVKTWDSYLVYAASLGVAKQAFRNMSLIVPFEKLEESSFRPISYHYYDHSVHGFENACSSPNQGVDGTERSSKSSSFKERGDGPE